MKKTMLMLATAVMLSACEKVSLPDEQEGGDVVVTQQTKKFTFTVKGDFGEPQFTRAYLSADGQEMTDLWVFDFVDGVCIQSLHQDATSEDWGAPQMHLQYGEHHIYFVASRGDSPVLDEDAHTIIWSIPRDTFWKDYEVDVVSTSNGNRAVTLDRMATKLKVTIEDEVPDECASVTITPSTWYYGMNYQTGAPVAAQEQARTVSIPSSYIGTSGQLSLSLFGISPKEEWTTDLAIVANSSEGTVIGSATLHDAPFKANRGTEYSGNLWGSNAALSCSLQTDWEDSQLGTW